MKNAVITGSPHKKGTSAFLADVVEKPVNSETSGRHCVRKKHMDFCRLNIT